MTDRPMDPQQAQILSTFQQAIDGDAVQVREATKDWSHEAQIGAVLLGATLMHSVVEALRSTDPATDEPFGSNDALSLVLGQIITWTAVVAGTPPSDDVLIETLDIMAAYREVDAR